MNLLDIKSKLNNIDIPDDLLLSILFEMSRYYDKDFVDEVKKVQKEKNIVFNSSKREILRKQYYYGEYFNEKLIEKFPKINYSQSAIDNILADLEYRLENYNEQKILQSINQRYLSLNKSCDLENENWLLEYKKFNKGSKFSFLECRIDQKWFKKNDYSELRIFDFICRTYDLLENYRHFAFVIDGELYNKEGACVTWQILSKVCIYCENFVRLDKDYSVFRREKKIEELVGFLKERNIENAAKLASDFYRNISCGYRFKDCYVSDNQGIKILILKKIALDVRNIPCPDCYTTLQSINGYPEMLQANWECKNPDCPSRSKSGRGKRFDAYGIYRNLMLEFDNELDRIDTGFYKDWHRDIFDNGLNWREMLLREYMFSNECFLGYNDDFSSNCKNMWGRKQIDVILKTDIPNNFYLSFADLPLVVLLKSIHSQFLTYLGVENISQPIIVKNNNSSLGVAALKPNQIGTIITSPPYYNAREYSQWSNLICYLVDMMINTHVIYNSCEQGSYYLYNIGDVVAEDNVYISTLSSKRRIPLGFLSYLIFDIVGFNLTGNILWDKGEVQSKRNSTNNLYSGFIKCVNCYEHFLVFRKGNFEFLSNSVERIVPVIKINNKGENIAKHTAPYPLDLVGLSRPYINKDKYILDPFLGSGTTLVWCKQNGFKGIGFELNKDYYDLCLENINGDGLS